MSPTAQLRSQTRFDLLMFLREPAATFFTVAFPLILLFLFTGIFGNEQVNAGRDDGSTISLATFYVPGILALAIISATLVNASMTMVTRRERGMLKRVRGTPLRPWVFVGSQALSGVVISVFMTVLVIIIGALIFDVTVRAAGLPALIVSVLLGAVAFAALGLALTAIIPSESAAPAVTNAIVLPLYFISDVFIIGDKPDVLEWIANVFPVQHLARALFESFDPLAPSTPAPWGHWLVLAAWGLFGLVVTLLTFRWTPRR